MTCAPTSRSPSIGPFGNVGKTRGGQAGLKRVRTRSGRYEMAGWSGEGEPSAQVVPERHSELLAGFHQAQEHIPAIPAHVAAGSAADLAPGHLGPDVVF